MCSDNIIERGAATLMSLVFMAVLLVIALAGSQWAQREFREGVHDEIRGQLFHVAEAGVDEVLFLLESRTYNIVELKALTDPLEGPVTAPSGEVLGTYSLRFFEVPGASDSGKSVLVRAQGVEDSGRFCRQVRAIIERSDNSDPVYRVAQWYQDPTCGDQAPPPEPDPEPDPEPACSNNNDDDGDGLIDDADPGCHTDGDASNTASYDPDDTDETDVVATCSDGSSWTRVENSDPATTYIGEWTRISNSESSGGDHEQNYFTSSGEVALYSFEGSCIRWIVSGIPFDPATVDVYIDGEYRTSVSGYVDPAQPQFVAFEATDLGAGLHDIRLVRQASNDDSQPILHDAFDYAGSSDNDETDPPPSEPVTVDLKINSSDGPVTLTGVTATLNMAWTVTGSVTGCEATQYAVSGNGSVQNWTTGTAKASGGGSESNTIENLSTSSEPYVVELSLLCTPSDGSPLVEDTRIRVTLNPPAQCSDGVDNDGDGHIDNYDAGCVDGTDTDESDDPDGTACNWERTEDGNSPAYTESDWVTRSDTQASGGSYISNVYSGAGAVGMNFSGPCTRWISKPAEGDEGGPAHIYIDGSFVTTIQSPDITEYQQVMFSTNDLGPGDHTIEVDVGTNRIQHDAFDYHDDTPEITWTRVENSGVSNSTQYVGTWYVQSDLNASGGSHSYNVQSYGRASLSFNGTAVRWISTKTWTAGEVDVYIDGVFQQRVNAYADNTQYQQVLFEKTDLSPGSHTIEVRKITTNRIYHDAFDYAQ